MNNVEKALLDALVDLDRAVATIKTATPKPNLLASFKRIDDLAAQLPPDTDHTLMHYLQKKSYEKARLFLQDLDSENQPGPCGHV